MALMDRVKDAANSAVQQAQGAVQEAMERDESNVRNQGAGGIMQGLMGNYSSLSPEDATRQYGMYLMPGESFVSCFALLRDKMMFTNKRIIFIDHKGMTGTKVRVDSINLNSVIDVRLETGGAGFDHAELSFSYFTSPYYKAYNPTTDSKVLEFPKGFNVQPLYCMLEELAYGNVERLNA